MLQRRNTLAQQTAHTNAQAHSSLYTYINVIYIIYGRIVCACGIWGRMRAHHIYDMHIIVRVEWVVVAAARLRALLCTER